MSEAHVFAIGILLAWLAGVRAYLTVFGVGIAGAFGWLDLPPALEATTSPWVLGVSGVLGVLGLLGVSGVSGVSGVLGVSGTILGSTTCLVWPHLSMEQM